MVYYTSTDLSTIKQEINVLLATELKKEVEKYKNTTELNIKKRDEFILLSIAREIINSYSAVTSTTDNIINQISEANLQILVNKVYKAFPTLKYPNFINA